MLKHFISIAWRNILKKKTISLINILGLTIGIASSILIFLWVNDELNFDKFHNNFENIYRVYITESMSTGTYSQLAVQAPLANALKEKYPEIKNSSRFFILSKSLIKTDQKEFWESKIAFADNSFFNIFTFPFIEGNSKSALQDVNSIVLTKAMADKYFPKTNPIGKVLSIQNNTLTVTGIIENIPNNSSLQFDFIISFNFLNKLWDWPEMNSAWNSSSFYTYLLLNKNLNTQQFEKRLAPFYNESLGWQDYELHLQPFNEAYLNPIEIGEYNLSGSKKTVYLFSFVAILILIIVSINFINLYTANSLNKAKEIGVKKCIGSKKVHIRSQFLVETTTIIFIAFILAMTIVAIVLPSFNVFVNKEMIINLSNYRIIIGIIFILFSISILAGIYPAFYLASLKPEKILKGNFLKHESKFSIRKVLIVFQFSITILLIVVTSVAYKQMIFINEMDLGFSKDLIVNLTMNDETKYKLLKNELLKIPSIKSVTATEVFSAESVSNTSGFNFDGKPENMDFNLTIQQVDFDYLKTFDVEIVDGRDFSQKIKTDATSAFILNEKAVKMMEINKPIGKTFELWGNKGTIIGVAKDANFLSLKLDMDPRLYMIKLADVDFENVLIKLNSTPLQDKNAVSNVLANIKGVWKEIYPDTPFDFQFVDQIYDRIYKIDIRNNKIFAFFTILAIAISCLGLLGLTLLSAQQRTKEISIRKVHGATLTNIMTMLNISFIKLIVVAFIISIPIAYYTSYKLLQTYAYRTNISWWIFLLAGIAVVLIAIITVSYQSWSISKTNPIEKLKYE